MFDVSQVKTEGMEALELVVDDVVCDAETVEDEDDALEEIALEEEEEEV